MILHDNAEADEWFRLARYSGRHEGVPVAKDKFAFAGWLLIMEPMWASRGLQLMSKVADDNPDQEEWYQDLSQYEHFTTANRD